MAEIAKIQDYQLPGEPAIDLERVAKSALAQNPLCVSMGAHDRNQEIVEPDENGVGYVLMNHSGRLDLGPDEDGLVATGGLAGCTGVAGFAKRADGGTHQFVSHYDPISQEWAMTHNDSPINQHLYGQKYRASQSELAGPVQYVVSYGDTAIHSPDYGKRVGNFDQWHYLDQIETTISQLGPEAEIAVVPYGTGGNVLAAGRIDGAEGIFWNGVPIDFDQIREQQQKQEGNND
ncbi:MAG TPA: hypothetical protein VHT70_04660 [Candidatus Saccharimonadales bacterium]|jgi:hypothetical protein|nr:hypothetical protein [Candidatus Saccharimonadales bacterium]